MARAMKEVREPASKPAPPEKLATISGPTLAADDGRGSDDVVSVLDSCVLPMAHVQGAGVRRIHATDIFLF